MHEIPCHIDEPVKKDWHSLVTTHHSSSLLMVLLNHRQQNDVIHAGLTGKAPSEVSISLLPERPTPTLLTAIPLAVIYNRPEDQQLYLIVRPFAHTKINFPSCGCSFTLPLGRLLTLQVIMTRQTFCPDPSEFPESLESPHQWNDTPSILSNHCIVLGNTAHCALERNTLDRAFFFLGTRGSHSKQAMFFFLPSRLLSLTDNTTLFIGTLIY